MLQEKKRLSARVTLAFAVAAFALLSMLPASVRAGSAALLVTVDISPALKAKANPGQAVFIYVKAARDPKAPLAAVKTRVDSLPVTVTLDDSMALTPRFKLSNFKEVKVTAHVSQTGQAIRRSGDLEGESPEITLGPGKQPVKVTIDHVVD